MKITLQCGRCEEECVGWGETEREATHRAARDLAEHLRWFHGKEMLEEAEAESEAEEEVGMVDATPAPLRTLRDAFPVNTSMQDAMLAQLERCWAIMLHRCKKYDEAWLRRGANGNVLEILKLSDRIKAQLWDHRRQQGDLVSDDDLDDLRDLVNYALVCLTQAELGQWNSRG